MTKPLEEMPPLHDAGLIGVEVSWATPDEDAVVVVTFKPSFRLAGSVVTAHLTGFTYVEIPREFPWGPSDTVLEASIHESEAGVVLVVQCQSGDRVEVRGRTIAWFQEGEPDPGLGWIGYKPNPDLST